MLSITQNDGEGGEMGVEEGRKATGGEKKIKDPEMEPQKKGNQWEEKQGLVLERDT